MWTSKICQKCGRCNDVDAGCCSGCGSAFLGGK